MPDFVYILEHHWNTPDNEGYETRVFASLDDAAKAMHESVVRLKAEFPDDPWEDDYTWEDTMEVHLGFDDCRYLGGLATIYSWEILEWEVE